MNSWKPKQPLPTHNRKTAYISSTVVLVTSNFYDIKIKKMVQ
uniref:Uncharacterized protein n=1 Tax=Anguilla anguilla TaxID=7936 RepID=A0A0E9VP23_ANGAN